MYYPPLLKVVSLIRFLAYKVAKLFTQIPARSSWKSLIIQESFLGWSTISTVNIRTKLLDNIFRVFQHPPSLMLHIIMDIKFRQTIQGDSYQSFILLLVNFCRKLFSFHHVCTFFSKWLILIFRKILMQ